MKEWVPEETLREIDNAMEEFKKNFLSQWMPIKGKAFHPMMRGPRIDLNDGGDHYDLFVEVPSVKKKVIQVHLTKNAVEVSAEVEEKMDNKGVRHRLEEPQEIYRKIFFPGEVLPEETEAIVANGLLKITVPK